MSNILKSKSAKLVLGLVAFAFAFTSANVASAYVFTAPTLKTGSRSSQVMELQKALNMCADTMIATGAGSTGYETTYFGAKTAAVVKIWQAKMGLTADGLFGPASRAKMNASGCGTTGGTLPAGCTSTSGFSPITGQACNGGSTIPQTGPVTASLSATTPAAGPAIAGTSAELARFVFTGNGTVSSVNLMKDGVSANATLSGVYLYDGGTRLTDPASVTSNGMITFNGLNMTVSGSRTISVRSDIDSSATAGQQVRVSLSSFVANSTTVTASVLGNFMTVIAAPSDIGTAFLSTSNTVGTPSVDAGTSNYTIWGNTLTIGQRSLWFKGANFRVIGSVETGALQNARLIIDGAQVGTAVASVAANGTLSFDLSAAPVAINVGAHTVEVRADVVGGANRNFYVSLQNAGDLMLTDSQYNATLLLKSGNTSTAYNMSTGGNTGTVTVNNGTLSISNDSTFNTGSTVTSGGSNVTIARYNVKAYGEALKVMQMTVTINPAATAGDYFQNVGLYVNGAQVGSSVNTTTDPQTLTFNLGSSFIVPAGATVPVEVRANLVNGSGVNFAGTVATSVTIPQYQAQGMSSYSLYPSTSGGISSGTTTVTVGAVSVTLAKATAYQNQTLSTNAAHQKIGSYIIQAGNTEGVRVTNLAVAISGTITTTFVDAGSTTLASTGSKTVNVASTAGMTVGDTVVIEAGATDFAGTITAVDDGDTLTVNGTTAGSTDPTADGAAVVVTPASMSAITNNLTNLQVVVNGGAASNPINPQATNNITTDFTVAAGQTQTIEVYADLGSRTGTVATTLTATARGASSNTSITDFDPNTGGTQTTISGQTITQGTGTLGAGSIVSVNTATAHYVLGGSSTETIIRYNFTSTSGPSTITELWFTLGGTSGAITSLTAVGSNGGTCNGYAVGTTVYMSGCNITIPTGNAGSYITVTPTYNTVGNGINAGSTATVDLTHVNSTSGSGSPTGQTAVTLAASNSMTLVATLPSLTLSSVGTVLPSGSGTVKVGSVTIAAGAGGNVRLTALPVTVVVSGGAQVDGAGTVNAISLKEGNTTITTTDNLTTDVTTATAVVSFSNDEQVAFGTSRTFDIYVAFDTVTGGDDSASLTIPTTGFAWDDITGGATGLSGALILNYPTNTVSIND